jgi:transposase
MPVRVQSPAAQAKCIGADVGSKEVALAAADASTLDTPVTIIANTEAAITRWLKTLPAGCRIGMEATGRYHEHLAELAWRAGHVVFVFNPAKVAKYLAALRSRAKNDVLDARGIARYVLNESMGCHPYVPPGPFHTKMALLIQRRHQLVKQRESLRMSLADLPDCDAQLKALKQAFKRLLAAIDAQIEAVYRTDAALQARRKRLCSILGFGRLVSAAVAARLSRTPYANSDAVVAAFGLDLRVRDSGQFRGQRKLSKQGNAEERRLIYMAAVSACNSPLFRALRDKLLAKGRSPIQAHCTIARKLLRIAFAVWTTNQPFKPSLVGTA